MAKYVKKFKGDYEDFVKYIEDRISAGSFTVSLEESIETNLDDVKCKVITYERYGMLSENRVSLSVTILNKNDEIQVLATTSGGSGAMIFKMNYISEESFINTLANPIEEYIKNKNLEIIS